MYERMKVSGNVAYNYKLSEALILNVQKWNTCLLDWNDQRHQSIA
jgi:hypothetical protein